MKTTEVSVALKPVEVRIWLDNDERISELSDEVPRMSDELGDPEGKSGDVVSKEELDTSEFLVKVVKELKVLGNSAVVLRL